jgi:UDP-3-O-[3-hydroxymyristoyl] glucosamine N-acyltransferase
VSATLGELAELVQGTIHGDRDLVLHGARPITDAAPGDITFVESEKYAKYLHGCRASAAVVPFVIAANGKSLIQVRDALDAFVTIVRHLQGWTEPAACGIDSRAAVHPRAVVHPRANVGAFAVVGEDSVVGPGCWIHSGAVIGRRCRIGSDVILHPQVVLYDGTVIGDRVIIHAGAVIGADGFGYRCRGGRHWKVPQLGHVEIGDDVEIGAGTTIDRGTFQATVIGAGTKIDNLVQVGHNCRIGQHNLIVSQVGVGGSSTTGDFVILAGQAGVADHLRIGDGAIVGAKAGVSRDVPAGQRVLGIPATAEHDQKRIMITLEKLPEMRRELRRIRERLGLHDEPAPHTHKEAS